MWQPENNWRCLSPEGGKGGACQFDAKTGEFINENPQPDNKEDLLKEQEKLEGNISEYLGKNINEVVKKFDNMREYEPAFGVWYGNEYVELYSEDVYDANNNPIITSRAL